MFPFGNCRPSNVKLNKFYKLSFQVFVNMDCNVSVIKTLESYAYDVQTNKSFSRHSEIRGGGGQVSPKLGSTEEKR